MSRLGLALAIALAGVMPAQAGQVLDAIQQRGVLRVGTTGDYKPYSFLGPDGVYRGADIEMARRIALQLGVRLELVPTKWGSIMADFEGGAFDMAVGGVTVLPARAAAGAFSTVLVVDGKRPIARCADANRFVDLAAIDQPDVRVIVNPGAANEAFARENFPHAALRVHADNATVFDEILAGRADVMVTDGIEVDHQAYLHRELCAATVPTPFTRLEKAYWLKRDAEFESVVDGVVTTAKADGSWASILDTAQQQP